MSENFAYISLASFLCYILLFFTFIAAKKNRIINSFIGLLICTSLWTGGSFLMRINLFGATKLWYDVSIFGMTWALYAVLLFTLNYIGIKKSHKKPFWFFVILITNIVNISTGFLLAAPDLVVTPSGHTTFVYTYGAGVVLFSLISLAIIVDSFIIAARKSKHNDVSSTQLLPIMIGLFVVFIGNIAIMLPVFTGFPIDILAGLVNALILFYALFLRRLFKLTLLVSKTNCYFVSAIFSVLIFGNLINTIESFISTYFHVLEEYKTLVIALIFTTSISAIYFLLKKFFDTVFLGAENIRNENLRQFSFAASKSLELNDILELLVCVIKKTIGVRKVYVCILDQKTNGYKMIHTTSPLDKPNYYIQKDNPLVLLLKKQNQCLLLSNFNRTIEYKSMWENEKKQISDLDIECFMPLKDNDTLVGFIMLTSKDKKVPFSYEDISFLDSVSSISSIAVKNSRMYQKMYYEAHTDELTDVLNRKYFFEVLQDEWTNNITSCLSLIMLSVDDFKLYNQLYGNNEGDIALKKIASILKSTVSENGYVARYSGKEFAIILPSRDVLFTKNLAQNLCTQISAINKSTSNYALKMLTASCGICAIPNSANNLNQLVENATMAVYQVKRNGKNGVTVYTAGTTASPTANTSTAIDSGYKKDVYSSYASSIYALMAAIDAKDHYTFNHSQNVAYYATTLSALYGHNSDTIEIIREAALLHDIGKISIPETILNKEDKLSNDEFRTMQQHVDNSIGIIKYLPSLDYVIPAVIGHHERFDGLGYPRKIAGENIPITARILTVADSFDAMVSKRCYKQALSVETALERLAEQAGKQFDKKLVELFIEGIKTEQIIPIL